MKTNLIIGTRQSLLAMWQSNYIAGRLREEYPGCEVTLKKIVTKGDRILDVPLAKIGGKGLFTKEIEQELLDGTIDLAVHSLKDMPTVLPEGLCLTAITERANAGDAFVSNKYNSIEELPEGSVLGTSSLRRRAQLLARRPDLKIVDLRGNVDTRLWMPSSLPPQGLHASAMQTELRKSFRRATACLPLARVHLPLSAAPIILKSARCWTF